MGATTHIFNQRYNPQPHHAALAFVILEIGLYTNADFSTSVIGQRFFSHSHPPLSSWHQRHTHAPPIMTPKPSSRPQSPQISESDETPLLSRSPSPQSPPPPK
ncbi:Secondary metabolism regulator LAE1, partial [Fusarium oxysporum f. sp. albedinis]